MKMYMWRCPSCEARFWTDILAAGYSGASLNKPAPPICCPMCAFVDRVREKELSDIADHMESSLFAWAQRKTQVARSRPL